MSDYGDLSSTAQVLLTQKRKSLQGFSFATPDCRDYTALVHQLDPNFAAVQRGCFTFHGRRLFPFELTVMQIAASLFLLPRSMSDMGHLSTMTQGESQASGRGIAVAVGPKDMFSCALRYRVFPQEQVPLWHELLRSGVELFARQIEGRKGHFESAPLHTVP